MTDELPMALKKLAGDRRAFGMTLRIEERPPPASLEILLADFGFSHPEEELSPISRDQAWDVVAHLVAYDQAYGSPTGVIDIAEDCADQFLALFPADARFFTNSSDALGAMPRSWRPLTEATFDAGVLVVSQSKVGVLWFEDED